MIKLSEPGFFSIQGEGPFAGTPSYFIRFFGCTLSCDFCDSKYSWSESSPTHKKFTEDMCSTLITDICDSNTKAVVLTGGEPLIHYHNNLFQNFIQKLLDMNIHVSIETTFLSTPNEIQNTFVIEKYYNLFSKNFMNKVLFVISPKLDTKCYNIEVTENQIFDFYSLVQSTALQLNNYPFIYKFIYDEKYVSLLDKLIETFPADFKRENVFMMPLTPLPFEKQNYLQSCHKTVDFCKDRVLRYSPRIHIDLWEMKKGV